MSTDLAEVEAVLRSMEPAASRVDFVRALYLAGRASATAVAAPASRRRGAWLWPCATAFSLLGAVLLAALWAASGNREVIERVVYVERDKPPTAAPQTIATRLPAGNVVQAQPGGPQATEPMETWEEYVKLREVVFARGIDGLPKLKWRSTPDRRQGGWDQFDDPAVRRFLGG